MPVFALIIVLLGGSIESNDLISENTKSFQSVQHPETIFDEI